jgi:hypothetical protein
MKIIYENNKRKLIKDDGKNIDISDGSIVLYNGIYYGNKNDIDIHSEVNTAFIGTVVTDRFYYESGITGIYIDPHYIWSKIQNKWLKIINKPIPKKYFLYPHLLMLPGFDYNYHPLYLLHTVENTKLSEYNDIIETFSLE